MSDNEMRTLESEFDQSRDALDKAAHYLAFKNAYEFENWTHQCNVHLRHVLQRATEWADSVEMSERIKREKESAK